VDGAQGGHACGGGVETEVNDHVPLSDDGAQVVAEVNLAGDFHLWLAGGRRQQRLAHPAL